MRNIRLVLAGFASIPPLVGCAAPASTASHIDTRADEQRGPWGGRPVHDALFDEWNLSAHFSAAEFEPQPPPDAYEIEVLELTGLP